MAQVQKKTQKKRIRGPNLSVFIKNYSKGVPFEEGLMRAEAEDRVMASDSRLSKALIGSDEWEGISEVFPCWSGTMAAYVEPGQKLGEKVEYVDPETGYRWVFAVPESHRGRKNVILVAEHPDYILEVDGKNRVVHATAVDLVENFPADDGWYKGDPTHGIPTGKGNPTHDIPTEGERGFYRHLWRIDRHVGPVARIFDGSYCYGRHYVDFNSRPSSGFGVAVESP